MSERLEENQVPKMMRNSKKEHLTLRKEEHFSE